MKSFFQQVREAAQFLKKLIHKPPFLGVLTGTGLGECLDLMDVHTELFYQKIPNFPEPTVESHYGRLLAGSISGLEMVAMQGRFHLYEGYSPCEVSFPIRVMQELNVKKLILTNAAGGLNLAFAPGDIMVIRDHINLTGENPLLGGNEDRWGIRFPDMTRVYDQRMMKSAEAGASANNIALRHGVYAGLKGPSLETPAETRFLRMIGADAVGFSTIMEAIAAVHAKMDILGLSVITNINDPGHLRPHTMEEIVSTARGATPKLAVLIETVAGDLKSDAGR